MKIDMHCHIKEGSLDGRIQLEENIAYLQKKGFHGMVITDHNTYKGYRYYRDHIKGKKFQDFVVFKGIEYDTRDAGHILVIMPEGVRMRLLELRGLPVHILIDFVHRHGGILGPAHPCGEKYLSFTKTKRFIQNPELMKRFDFIEIFNSCESEESNDEARKLAVRYRKPGTGGSDSHRLESAGMGYTLLPRFVTKESELIELIKAKEPIEARGHIYCGTARSKLGKAQGLYHYSFWVYNKWGSFYRALSRNKKLKVES